ncbi:DMT family transporter [Paenibacillus antarcticus]|uniref:Multidrug transporter n=1 Tax=Paenibacillus antarcticus TaxID=253703 RepID=A0A168Q1W0_9BACL|nr:multidrug efflux SMR transporter [Paenibacillus antarcticus]OAB47298.1 hypothetical protein PBAT_06220 [Paenibacillus antarcticus]
MHWLYLWLAIVFEVGGTLSMKLSGGFTKWQPSILLVVFYICSFVFLTLTLKGLEVSTVYAIWSGAGIVAITIIGFVYLGEHVNVTKVLSIVLIVIGVISLNLSSEKTSDPLPTVSESIE